MRGDGCDVECSPSAKVGAGAGPAEPGEQHHQGEGHVQWLRGAGYNAVDKEK